jgi:hypothetical protein
MAFDLDNLTTPSPQTAHEIPDPVNGWPDAGSTVYVDVNRMAGGVYQIGHDPAAGTYWLRFLKWDEGGGWHDWQQLITPPPPSPPPPAAGR